MYKESNLSTAVSFENLFKEKLSTLRLPTAAFIICPTKVPVFTHKIAQLIS